LKEFYRGLPSAANAWKRMDEEDKVVLPSNLIIGTLTDMLLTEPENIDSKFEFIPKTPPPMYSALIEEVVSQIEGQKFLGSDYDLDTIVLDARRKVGFYSNWKDETILKKFEEDCSDFISVFTKCLEEKKILCTYSDRETSEKLAESIKTDPRLSFYFPENPSEDFKAFNQVEVFWEQNGMKFKSKLDRVIIRDKVIYFTDIKTYAYNFLDNFYQYMYYLQASMYVFPFIRAKDDLEFNIQLDDVNKELLEFVRNPEYTICENFSFITVDKEYRNIPIEYVVPIDELLYMPAEIVITRADWGTDIALPGWFKMAEKLQAHISSDIWDTPFEILQGENKVLINI
jgi:hypothetical protein